ncbi:enoyl-[acyl-carrier-protein] reductase FabK [Calderihabitans maritimus]|uniref:Probable nitronate monooxygenase n=1 Tax=Calderihabitans maritimus TaxID=1246530 RepID=A0A1Z5HP51_9FIRM|nr:enoyl-[acyl-carrier-protein] reductase FabK [Calderihabitans maritimus]GAW91075.1 dioxygenases related to 2-nitropropane dioxygenase [Calderihabitans maritimus]
MLKTVLCELLGIEYPILQGGMAWVATGELAAAVSEAGGLGIIGAGNAPPEVVREEINKVRERTNKPFGVNIYYLSPYVEELIDLIIEEEVPVITTGAGNPGKHIPRLKEAGVKVIPVVASVALAKRLERQGVDALIAEGMECGGHIGEITTMALVPQVVDAVSIPVIAAGGIADGRGLAAALSLGAAGIQMGTRFVCADECIAHPNYKEAIIKAKDRDTVVTGTEGHYVRVLKNKLARQFAELAASGAPFTEFEKLGAGKLRAAVIEGDVEYGSLMAGQIAGLISEVKPAREIISEVVEEARRVIDRMQQVIKPDGR